MSPRTLVAALIAAAVGLGTVHTADAQLWKPKKKPAATAPAPKKARATARKRPTRKKPANSVVRFQPPPDRDADSDRSSDRSDRADEAPDFDDNPRITVVDGDR